MFHCHFLKCLFFIEEGVKISVSLWLTKSATGERLCSWICLSTSTCMRAMGLAKASATRASSWSLRCTRQNPPQSSNGSESSSAVSRSDNDELCLLWKGSGIEVIPWCNSQCVLTCGHYLKCTESSGTRQKHIVNTYRTINSDSLSRAYHRWQRRVQTGLCPAVLSIAVFITAAVINKTHLQVHPTLQPERKNTKKNMRGENLIKN